VTTSAVIRDIAIIVVAIESIFVFLLLGILVWQVWRLTKMIQTEVKPILDDAQDTLGTLRGTTTFVSDHVVTPVTRTTSKVAGMRRSASVLAGDLMPRRKKAAPPVAPVVVEPPVGPPDAL
jgi:hypothetical protein